VPVLELEYDLEQGDGSPLEILHNRIRCRHCGLTVESIAAQHFATHSCNELRFAKGPQAWIAADGGRRQLRRIGDPFDYDEAAITNPPLAETPALLIEARQRVANTTEES
jgi:hypothetical protein